MNKEFGLVEVVDKRILVNSPPIYSFVKGSDLSTYRIYTATSKSSSGINWTNINPPSVHTFVNKCVQITYVVRIDFTGTAPAGYNLLDTWGNSASLRCFPISNSISTCNLSLNTSNFSMNTSDILPCFLNYRFKNNKPYYNLSPNKVDNFQSYDECSTVNSCINNPMAGYGDSKGDDIGRGSHQYSIVPGTNTPTTGSILLQVTEPLLLSPLEAMPTYNGYSFVGLSNMSISITNENDLFSTFVSIAPSDPNTNLSGTVDIQQANITFNYLSVDKNLIQQIPKEIHYNYYNVERYVTNFGTIVPAGQKATINANSLQINSTPKAIYVYLRENKSFRNARSTDTFARINNISIDYANHSGLLNPASPSDLFRICYENGYDHSFYEWYGNNINNPQNSRAKSGAGSVMKIIPHKDLCTNEAGNSSSGITGYTQFLVKCDIENISNRDINYSIYVVVVSDGYMTISRDGYSSKMYNSFLTNEMVDVNKNEANDISTEDIQNSVGLGFFDDVKSFFKRNFTLPNLISAAKTVAPIVKTLYPASAVPLSAVGLGKGGAMYKKNNLKYLLK
jgi:hypothetical protein